MFFLVPFRVLFEELVFYFGLCGLHAADKVFSCFGFGEAVSSVWSAVVDVALGGFDEVFGFSFPELCSLEGFSDLVFVEEGCDAVFLFVSHDFFDEDLLFVVGDLSCVKAAGDDGEVGVLFGSSLEVFFDTLFGFPGELRWAVLHVFLELGLEVHFLFLLWYFGST